MSVPSIVDSSAVRAPKAFPRGHNLPAVGREALMYAARLALGKSDGLDAVGDWEAVVRAAVAERCATLAWVRSGAAISSAAPREITAEFRSHFAANTMRVCSALSSAHATTNTLKERGICPIILKGPPLAVRLYGDLAARVCNDLDWFVPATARPVVHDVMVREGWRVIEGDGGEGTCYARSNRIGETYLEVHSSLFHPRFSYLPVPPPTGKPMVIDGTVALAHDDALLAGYLATHVAMHRFAPLAWLIDVLELWTSLDESARVEARQAARAHGLGRYLEWTLGRAALLSRVADGDVGAWTRLGFRDGSRVDPHPMWRHIALAPGAADMARAAWAWIAPEWVTHGRANVLRTTVSRVARHWRDALPVRQPLA